MYMTTLQKAASYEVPNLCVLYKELSTKPGRGVQYFVTIFRESKSRPLELKLIGYILVNLKWYTVHTFLTSVDQFMNKSARVEPEQTLYLPPLKNYEMLTLPAF
jgi:hypothetical protein